MPDPDGFDVDITLSDAAQSQVPAGSSLPPAGTNDPSDFDLDVKFSGSGGPNPGAPGIFGSEALIRWWYL